MKDSYLLQVYNAAVLVRLASLYFLALLSILEISPTFHWPSWVDWHFHYQMKHP